MRKGASDLPTSAYFGSTSDPLCQVVRLNHRRPNEIRNLLNVQEK